VETPAIMQRQLMDCNWLTFCGHKQKAVVMRKAALAAGTVQLLYGMFTIAPQIFGMNFSSAPDQTAFRIFTIVACLLLATFFFGIVTTPMANVGGAVRIASVVAAAALIVENLPYAYHQILGTTAAASESWLWKYHPLQQFAHILGLAIPMLAEITMVAFLLAVQISKGAGPETGTREPNPFLDGSVTHGGNYVRHRFGRDFLPDDSGVEHLHSPRSAAFAPLYYACLVHCLLFCLWLQSAARRSMIGSYLFTAWTR
jgi:hypothetical protein